MRPAATSPFAALGSESRAFVAPYGRPESLLFACPKRSNQEKGHPGFVQRSLCERCALRCSQSGSRRVRAGARRSCAAAERGHPWPRTCAPFPAGLLRYSARTRAVARGAGRQSSSSGSAIHPDRSEAAARMAASWGPCRSAGGWRISPQGRAHDARVFFASTRMCCRKTPQAERALAGQDARRATGRGGLLFGYFLLATQEKVTRADRRSD